MTRIKRMRNTHLHAPPCNVNEETDVVTLVHDQPLIHIVSPMLSELSESASANAAGLRDVLFIAFAVILHIKTNTV